MTVRTLRITEQRSGRRYRIAINGIEVFIRESFREAIVKLSKSNGWTQSKDLNSEPSNFHRYAYKWHGELADPKAGGDKRLKDVKLLENDKRGGWRIAAKEIQWECEFGRVPV